MNELNVGTRQKGLSTAEICTYIIIVIVLAATGFGIYFNSRLETLISEAVALGETQKAIIEAYFSTNGTMPQSGAEAALEGFTPTGVLKELIWHPGALGEPDSDVLRTGTLNGLVNLDAFGDRFEELESGYLLIARVQDDGTIVWDCMADNVTKKALPRKYLPETCVQASKADEKEVLEALR